MTWDSEESNALRPTAPLKVRGAASYVTGRYASTAAVGVDDGWGGPDFRSPIGRDEDGSWAGKVARDEGAFGAAEIDKNGASLPRP